MTDLTSGTPATSEKKYFAFRVTRDCTESAEVQVLAKNIEEAHAIATSREHEGKLKFALDDGSGDELYIADEDDYEELTAAAAMAQLTDDVTRLP